jgi:hypothetical protein
MVSITVGLIVESGVISWFPKTAKNIAHYGNKYSAWNKNLHGLEKSQCAPLNLLHVPP